MGVTWRLSCLESGTDGWNLVTVFVNDVMQTVDGCRHLTIDCFNAVTLSEVRSLPFCSVERRQWVKRCAAKRLIVSMGRECVACQCTVADNMHVKHPCLLFSLRKVTHRLHLGTCYSCHWLLGFRHLGSSARAAGSVFTVPPIKQRHFGIFH